MDRTVAPVLGEGHVALNEWKYLAGILSNEPVDSAQLDFYLLMANKGNSSASSSGISSNSNSNSQKLAFQGTSTEKFGNRFGSNEVLSPSRMKSPVSG